MEFEYRGKTWLRSGFRFPGLLEYIEKAKEELAQPLQVPMYATAGEAEHIHAISEKAMADPYFKRTAFNQAVRNMNMRYSNVHAVGYRDNQRLYHICLFVTEKMANTVPMIFLYTTSDSGYLYNASALDYRDKVWIYISSQFFSEHSMLRDEELCFLLGHELGHAQCHHSTLKELHDWGNSDREYSADRAGLIACAQWIRKNDPSCPMRQVAELSVLYAASLLQKIASAGMSKKGTIKWADFDYDSVQDAIHNIFKGASKMAASISSHPHTRHRIMAMVHFSQSQLFYRCLGEDPDQYKNLLSDQQLHNIMQYQLIGS